MKKTSKIRPYPCRCDGKLVKAPLHIEYFGIDFGDQGRAGLHEVRR